MSLTSLTVNLNEIVNVIDIMNMSWMWGSYYEKCFSSLPELFAIKRHVVCRIEPEELSVWETRCWFGSWNHPLQLAFETRPRCSCHRTGSSKGWSSNLPTRESETDCANWKSKQYQVSKSSKVASQAPLVLRHTSSPFAVWLPHWWKAETTQHSSWAWALFSLRRSLDLA